MTLVTVRRPDRHSDTQTLTRPGNTWIQPSKTIVDITSERLLYKIDCVKTENTLNATHHNLTLKSREK